MLSRPYLIAKCWPALFAAVCICVAGCGRQQQQAAAQRKAEVTAQTVQQAALDLPLTYFAKTMGSREVEVRARVSGILLQRRYQEGKPVRQGQPMFVIDPERFQAAVQQAQAEVGVEQAKLDDARRQKDRLQQLFSQKLVSQQQLDTAASTFEIAQASTKAAQAKLRSAQLDLNYTDVQAPISGLTSSEALSEGSLISAGTDSSLLTRIVQIDPLYVEFSVPQSEAALLRLQLPANGKASTANVKIELEDGSTYPQSAPLTFIDNAVQNDSGTVRARAVLKNPNNNLIPGQFVRVHIEGLKLDNVIAVPRRAVLTGPQGNFVWVVAANDQAEARPVQLGQSVGQQVIVNEGLKAGERYVVDGVLSVNPGAQLAVTAAPEMSNTQARRKDAEGS